MSLKKGTIRLETNTKSGKPIVRDMSNGQFTNMAGKPKKGGLVNEVQDSKDQE